MLYVVDAVWVGETLGIPTTYGQLASDSSSLSLEL